MNTRKTFGLIGAAGYIAPRHINAIKENNGQLCAALDKFDSVGILDRYFSEADFFTEPERFDRYLYKRQRNGQPLDFVSICSPNYLHDAHIRMALRNGSDAICEKPLVLNPWNVDALQQLEKDTNQRIYNILQLRLHPAIIDLREKINQAPADKIYDIDLTYITSRGKWYYESWKGDPSKSGGITTNIGIHFFDMLQWIFGKMEQSTVHMHEANKAAGFLHLKKARVRWLLSLDFEDIPQEAKDKGMRTYRSITVENEEIEFSGGFTDLHTQAYRHLLNGQGFGLDDARACIELGHHIRNSQIKGLSGDFHPLLKQ
ncbi:Gfo/Idh/MocA family oxidoreductase [Sunxiuqinia sp. sy24]|uniref:Gfo/Idh/MocA family oxidoreductase n=1 Tax=Sunxiuqinia sp. sy24 TaxID=3461495 RepID=UPI004045891B